MPLVANSGVRNIRAVKVRRDTPKEKRVDTIKTMGKSGVDLMRDTGLSIVTKRPSIVR